MSVYFRGVSLCILSYTLLMSVSVKSLHAEKPNPTTKDQKPTPDKDKAASKVVNLADFQKKIASDVDMSKILGDAIPCEFSRYELLALRPAPEVLILTAADEDFLRSAIANEALAPENKGVFPDGNDQARSFAEHISVTSFQGRTPSEALSKILEVLAQDTTPTEEARELRKAAASRKNREFAEYLHQTAGLEPANVLAALGSSEADVDSKISIAQKLTAQMIKTASARPMMLLREANKSTPDFQKYLQNTYVIKPSGSLLAQPVDETTEAKLEFAARLAEQSANTELKSEVAEATKLKNAEEVHDAAEDAKKGPATAVVNNIAQAAQQATAMVRPKDVACSMSILSYTTTKYAFGQKMADEFIPVQIVVRNLNPKKEFLVHDAKFAVDDDINGRLSSYMAGVDKLTARTFMLASRDYSYRNLTLHFVEGVGSVLSSTSLVYGSSVKEAANVFSGGFIPAFKGVWTDHSTEQLNLLNDEGFSSYRTERTIVPKSGTAEFVIFVRADQFEEGWWTQPCAEQIVVRNPDEWTESKQVNDKGASERQTAKCVGQFNLEKQDPKCRKDPGTRLDLESRRHVCIDYYRHRKAVPVTDTTVSQNPSDEQISPPTDGGNQASSANHSVVAIHGTNCNGAQEGSLRCVDSTPLNSDLVYFNPEPKSYKSWSPTAVALFRELSLAVVAGTHIEEESETKPTLTKIECPKTDAGDLDFDKAEKGSLSCTLSGTNLDKVQTVKLRNSDNPSETASGIVSPGADSKSATVSFPLDQLGALKGKLYKAYIVSKDGVEYGGDLTLNLAQTSSGNPIPFLPKDAKPDPAEITLDKPPAKISLKGFHLDQMKSVQFGDDDNKIGPLAVSNTTATTAEVKLTTADTKQVKNNVVTLSIYLFSKDTPNTPIPTGQSVSIKSQASAGEQPPAASADEANKDQTKAASGNLKNKKPAKQ
jgi:hypothetical protein